MREFKYIVGQEVKVKSEDNTINGLKVRIVSRFHGQWVDNLINTNCYKVIGDEPGIVEYIPFYEDQLEVNK